MQRWGFRNQSMCPRCKGPMEDKNHIFKCPAESVVQQWTKALEDLNGWLESVKTHPQLRHDLIAGLKRWHDEEPGSTQVTNASSASQIQDTIGWGLALEGCIAKQWRDKQEQFWKVCKS